jgi:TM2 domain-containing membrane protein YozV
MSHNDEVYDLGEVGRTAPEPHFRTSGTPLVAEQFETGSRARGPGSRPRLRSVAPGNSAARSTNAVGPGLAGSLSMFVPGLGQMIAGETAWGLFYLSGIGFCAATIWAAMSTLDRLIPTLRLLNVPSTAVAVTIASLALFTMLLHLAAVLHAHAIGGDDRAHVPHPLVAGLASLLIPGWGQLLAGHRRRATLFLGGVWVLATAWLMVTPRGTQILAPLGLLLPGSVRDGWVTIALMAAPLALWAIAVYDAAAGAASERRRA